jgi:hypothetical protein
MVKKRKGSLTRDTKDVGVSAHIKMKQFDLVLKFDDYNYPYASMEEAPHGKYVLAHEAFEENPEYEWSHRYAKWIKKEKEKPTVNYLEPAPTLEETLEAVKNYLKWWREQPGSRERSIIIGQLGHITMNTRFEPLPQTKSLLIEKEYKTHLEDYKHSFNKKPLIITFKINKKN